MGTARLRARLKQFVIAEWQALVKVNTSDRRWHMPLAAALATGLPVVIGAWFEQLAYGLLSSVGALVFLYLPSTPLYHRMAVMLAAAFVMCGSYAMGAMIQFWPVLMVPVLTLVAIAVTMLCRFYAIGPPAGLFFIMAAAIGAYTPMQVLQFPLMVGLVTLGALLACLIALLYSLAKLRAHRPQPVPPLPAPTFGTVVFEPVVIGCFVGISLLLAQVLQLPKAYWVPVSCLAVIQGASFRAIWHRQLQRVLGTGIGLLVAWGLLLLAVDKWWVAGMMIVLTFVIETFVVRHYAIAVVFITPLAILLAEAATLGQGATGPLIQARFFDTLLGALIGLIGGACLHSTGFRSVLMPRLRRLIPAGLLP